MKDFKVMLASKLDESSVEYPCLISRKLDGIRAIYYKGEFYTRNQKVIRGMSHLKEVLKPLGNITLDGELLIPGMTFQKSSGLIRSFAETPEAEFHVFDMPLGEEIQETRLSTLDFMLRHIIHSQLRTVSHTYVNSAKEAWGLYRAYREEGYEGAMLKNIRGLYQNKRSKAWMKMKAVETYDVICVGFFEGQGRLTGTLGGIVIELDGVRVRVGGGFSDADRDYIWQNRSEHRGMICEIAAQELTPAGSLRHPRFITWRTDL